MGPYRLGPSIRRTAFGEVIAAMQDERDDIVELDLYDALASTALATPQDSVLLDVAHVVGLQHRHVAPIIASGFAEGVPYVVRHLRLGRTLAQLLDCAERIEVPVAVACLFSVAEAAAFLIEQGPTPGSCAMGGLGAADVFVGYDGAIQLVGLGLKRARGNALDPIAADMSALFSLARRLDAVSGAKLVSSIAGVTTAAELAKAVRKRDGTACASRRRLAAGALRHHFAAEIDGDRAFFGLPTLQ